ncbi:MAG: hypothetical protein R6X12_10530 [bacterium]
MSEDPASPPPEANVRPVPAAAGPDKPSQLQTLGILRLISGIVNCLIGLSLMFTVIWILPAAFGIVVGILEIINSTRLMATPVGLGRLPRHLAVLEIIAIINGSVFSLVVGILALVWENEPRVRDYFAVHPLAAGSRTFGVE